MLIKFLKFLNIFAIIYLNLKLVYKFICYKYKLFLNKIYLLNTNF
jgi:hypothetical protein